MPREKEWDTSSCEGSGAGVGEGGGNEGTPFCLLRTQHQCDSGSQ